MALKKETILEAIQTLIQNNLGKVELWYGSKGGWEGWLQAELFYYLSQNFKEIKREKKYPEEYPGMKCDLYVKEGEVEMYIELKADTQKTHPDMIEEYGKDVNRISDIHNSLGINSGLAIMVSKIDYNPYIGNLEVYPCETGIESDYLINVYPSEE